MIGLNDSNSSGLIKDLVANSLRYYGANLDDFVDSLESEIYRFFNGKTQELLSAVMDRLKVTCLITFKGQELANIQSQGEKVGHYYEYHSDLLFNDMHLAKEITVDESSGVLLENILCFQEEGLKKIRLKKETNRRKSKDSPAQEKNGDCFKIQFTFDYTFANCTDNDRVKGRQETVICLVKLFFVELEKYFDHSISKILKKINDNVENYLMRAAEHIGERENNKLSDDFKDIQAKLMTKLMMIADGDYQFTPMSVFLIWQDRYTNLRYYFTEAQEQFLKDELGNLLFEKLKTTPMPLKTSICYQKMKDGKMGFVHEWAELPEKKNPEPGDPYAEAEGNFLTQSVILIPMPSDGFLIGCRSPKLEEIPDISLEKLLRSFKRSVKVSKDSLRELQTGSVKQVLEKTLIGNSKKIWESRNQISCVAAYLARLIRKNYNDYKALKEKGNPTETAKFLQKLFFPTIFIRGPVGCGKSTHVTFLREEVQKYLQKEFGNEEPPSEFSKGNYVSRKFNHNSTQYGSSSSDVGVVVSELFGRREGFLSEDDKGSDGIFDTNFGEILFLDEVGELHDKTQALLLQLIQDRTYHRQGEPEITRVFPGILAFATWKDSDLLRKDFLSRATDFEVEVASLWERAKDIPLLVNDFLNQMEDHELNPLREVLIKCATKSKYRWQTANNRQLNKVLNQVLITVKGRNLISVRKHRYHEEDSIEKLFDRAYCLSEIKATPEDIPNTVPENDLPETKWTKLSVAESRERDEIWKTITKEEFKEFVDQKARGDRFEGNKCLFENRKKNYFFTKSAASKKVTELARRLGINKEDVEYFCMRWPDKD